jgi:hypothetical protein
MNIIGSSWVAVVNTLYYLPHPLTRSLCCGEGVVSERVHCRRRDLDRIPRLGTSTVWIAIETPVVGVDW